MRRIVLLALVVLGVVVPAADAKLMFGDLRGRTFTDGDRIESQMDACTAAPSGWLRFVMPRLPTGRYQVVMSFRWLVNARTGCHWGFASMPFRVVGDGG